MYSLFRSLLFRMEPEKAHALTLGMLRLAGALPPVSALLSRIFTAPASPAEAFGLRFRNAVGLAAGYDKDGLGWRGLACLGFGHIEIGTITPRPQPGNSRPRLFRLPEDQALINRMGFPGRGAHFAARRLEGRRPPGLILGANLGKNKDTPLEEAVADYLSLVQIFAPLADYLAINISSPNTEGLRRLQARSALRDLLVPLQAECRVQETRLLRRTPLLVKLSPDLSASELDDALDVLLETGVDGVIATNTTTTRLGLLSPKQIETGGLSGAPLGALALKTVRAIHENTGGRLPIIAVGGIMDPAGAQRYLEAGATLVQVYTGLVYAGPGLVKSIARNTVVI